MDAGFDDDPLALRAMGTARTSVAAVAALLTFSFVAGACGDATKAFAQAAVVTVEDLGPTWTEVTPAEGEIDPSESKNRCTNPDDGLMA